MGISDGNRNLYEEVIAKHEAMQKKVEGLVTILYDWGTNPQHTDIMEGLDRYIDSNSGIIARGYVPKQLEEGDILRPDYIQSDLERDVVIEESKKELDLNDFPDVEGMIKYSVIVNLQGISLHLDGNNHLEVPRRPYTSEEINKEKPQFVIDNHSKLKRCIRQGLDGPRLDAAINLGFRKKVETLNRKIKLGTEETNFSDTEDYASKEDYGIMQTE